MNTFHAGTERDIPCCPHGVEIGDLAMDAWVWPNTIGNLIHFLHDGAMETNSGCHRRLAGNVDEFWGVWSRRSFLIFFRPYQYPRGLDISLQVVSLSDCIVFHWLKEELAIDFITKLSRNI